MNKSVLTVKLISALEPAAEEHGYELVTVEVTGAANHPTLTIYLDTEGGITIDEVTQANSWITDIVEKIMEDFEHPYTLDISSPGINRPLRTRDHFEKAVGQSVVIKHKTGPDSSSKSKGELLRIDGPKLILKTKTSELQILINEVINAHINQKIVF